MRERRVRFAPSPTGPLHIGGVRTALYNYLFTKQVGGTFILRIEDTDSQRFVAGAEKYIIESLKWCGILPDEGVTSDGEIVEIPSDKHPYAPYRQSQRKPIYIKYAEELVEKGWAYYAFDSAEALDKLRKDAEEGKEPFTYNQSTRDSLKNSLSLSKSEVKELLENTTNWVIRFKMPKDRIIKMSDLIRGDIEVNTNTLDDKVLWKKTDELPTYHLANIVDDHLMKISEVIRGEEWLPSLPLHYLLYEAFGWSETQPNFAHLSLLLKPDGKGKLSKRDGDRLGFPVFPLEWINAEGEISRGYREDGYYPEAFINLLVLLGWNPGTEQELFKLEELIKVFSLDRVVKSGAKFNPEKAKWFNQEYLRGKSNQDLAKDFREIILTKEDIGFDNKTKEDLIKDDYLIEVCALIKERASFVQDLWELSDFMFKSPSNYDLEVLKKFINEDSISSLENIADFISNFEPFVAIELEAGIKELIKEKGWKMGAIMNTLRLALVGASKGPGLADIIILIGREEGSNRIKNLIKHIS